MKRSVCILMTLCLAFLTACTRDPKTDLSSDVAPAFAAQKETLFTLGSQLQADYSKTSHAYQYLKGSELFSLTISRGIGKNDPFQNAEETFTQDGIIIAYHTDSLHSEKNGSGQSETYGYYTAAMGDYLYTLSNPTTALHINEILSFEDALSIMRAPSAPPSGCELLIEEWSLRLHFDKQTVTVLLYPNDGGKQACSDVLVCNETEMDGVVCYLNDIGDTLAYSDGTHSIVITEVLREGTEYEYRTVSFAESIFELL